MLAKIFTEHVHMVGCVDLVKEDNHARLDVLACYLPRLIKHLSRHTHQKAPVIGDSKLAPASIRIASCSCGS